MEEILNVKSLGSLNRQFVSILRSEQEGLPSEKADPKMWDELLPQSESTSIKSTSLVTLDEAFANQKLQRRSFPYLRTIQHAIRYPRVILPGLRLNYEILSSYFAEKEPRKSLFAAFLEDESDRTWFG